MRVSGFGSSVADFRSLARPQNAESSFRVPNAAVAGTRAILTSDHSNNILSASATMRRKAFKKIEFSHWLYTFGQHANLLPSSIEKPK
jgi:hypothetical protein